METEYLRRVEEALSGTIQEQLRALVRDAREEMTQAAQRDESIATAHRQVVASQERLDSTINELDGRVSHIRADVNESFEIVRSDVEAFARGMTASLAMLGEACAELASRLDSIEHALGRIRIVREARSA